MSGEVGRVAVVIACYNAASTIVRAVRSALSQPEASEVIVVDDASIDETVARARSADDGSRRLRIIRQKQNKGPSAARNRGIAESHSPWIGILDSDDFFTPGRLAHLLMFIDQGDFIADDTVQVPEGVLDGPRRGILGSAFPRARTVGFTEFVTSNMSQRDRYRCELGYIKPIMRRSFLTQHNLRYQPHMRLGEDYELYARALANGARLLISPNQGYVSVVRPTSLSSQHSLVDLLHFRDCNLSLRKIDCLPQAYQKTLYRHYLSIDCKLQWRRLIVAVKERNVMAMGAPFLRPWPVPAYLAAQLKQDFVSRSARTLRLWASRIRPHRVPIAQLMHAKRVATTQSGDIERYILGNNPPAVSGSGDIWSASGGNGRLPQLGRPHSRQDRRMPTRARSRYKPSA